MKEEGNVTKQRHVRALWGFGSLCLPLIGQWEVDRRVNSKSSHTQNNSRTFFLDGGLGGGGINFTPFALCSLSECDSLSLLHDQQPASPEKLTRGRTRHS